LPPPGSGSAGPAALSGLALLAFSRLIELAERCDALLRAVLGQLKRGGDA
jgi:hypothetical protein